MKQNFLAIKRTAFGIITILLVCPFVSNAASLNDDQTGIQPIAIEQQVTTSPSALQELDKPEAPDTTPAEEPSNAKAPKEKSSTEDQVMVTAIPGAQENPTYADELYLHADFQVLRTHLEELFSTMVTKGTKEGELYAKFDKQAEETEQVKNPTYLDVFTNPELQTKLETPEVVARLKEIAGDSFSDVKSTDWFAQYIPLAVYYDVANGTGGATNEFQPNKGVTRPEFATMFARAANPGDQLMAMQESTNPTAEAIRTVDPNAWYIGAWLGLENGMLSVDGINNKKEIITGNMTRQEVAYAIATTYFPEFATYVPESSPFSDLKEWKLTEADFETKDVWEYFWESQSDPSKGVLPEQYSAMVFLHELGILSGSEGQVKPFDTVTKAECLVLLQKTAKVLGDTVQ